MRFQQCERALAPGSIKELLGSLKMNLPRTRMTVTCSRPAPSSPPCPSSPFLVLSPRPEAKKVDTILDFCVSSLRRGHANLLCIVPILTDDLRRGSVVLQWQGAYLSSVATVLAAIATGFFRKWMASARHCACREQVHDIDASRFPALASLTRTPIPARLMPSTSRPTTRQNKRPVVIAGGCRIVASMLCARRTQVWKRRPRRCPLRLHPSVVLRRLRRGGEGGRESWFPL